MSFLSWSRPRTLKEEYGDTFHLHISDSSEAGRFSFHGCFNGKCDTREVHGCRLSAEAFNTLFPNPSMPQETRYRLISSLPGVPTGTIYTLYAPARVYEARELLYVPGNTMDRFPQAVVEKNPDWFEKVEDAPPYPIKNRPRDLTTYEVRRELNGNKDWEAYAKAESALYRFFCQKKNDQAMGTERHDGLTVGTSGGDIHIRNAGVKSTQDQMVALQSLLRALFA